MLAKLLGSASLLFAGVVARQAVFNTNYRQDHHGLFMPLGDLSTLSHNEFTSLSHPAFPAHSVRVKKTSFCDGTVDSYTGYIDIEARHLFFYFFESRSNPDKDDVVFWTNGGPGGSSAIGLFMELGPCRILDGDGPKFHPESWNSNSNIFFIDQPVGVGYSYADHGESVGTTEEAAQDIAAFVSIFFENFTKFKGRPFHMSGESYGGRYLPLFASAIYDQNTLLVDAGLTPINLTSLMIGNGLTDFFSMMSAYYEMTCTSISRPPVLDILTCIRMKQALPRCEKWSKASCIDSFDAINCAAAMSFCDVELSVPFLKTKRNPYDISKMCDGELEDTLCYPETKHIAAYLSRPAVRGKLGVDPSVPANFSLASRAVGEAFIANLDEYRLTYHYVAALLERDVKILIYVGKNDWICNYIGNEKWTLALEWTGKEAFGEQELREWKVDGKVAGKTRTANGLTFATIDGAGHLVPYNKPKESLEMVNRWLKGHNL